MKKIESITIVELQAKVSELVSRINSNHKHSMPHLISLMKVVEELGEITSVLLESEVTSRKGAKKSRQEIKDHLSDELADIIIALIALGSDYGIDLDAAITTKFEVHRKRN